MRNTLMLALLLVAVPIVAQAAPDEHALRRELVQELAKHNVLPRDFARIASGGIYHTLAGSGHPLADRRISARPPRSLTERADAPRKEAVPCRCLALPMGYMVEIGIGQLRAGTPERSRFQFHCFDLPLQATAGAVEMAERTGFFTGIWSVCSCGDPGDGSSFVWIWGHTLFLVLDYLGDTGINNLHLFPPMLPPEEIEKRRKADRKD